MNWTILELENWIFDVTNMALGTNISFWQNLTNFDPPKKKLPILRTIIQKGYRKRDLKKGCEKHFFEYHKRIKTSY